MQEEEIRKRDILNKYLDLVKIDAEIIFQDKSTFEALHCVACRNDRHEIQFIKSGFCYVQCLQCGTIFANPRPSQQNLMKIYTDSPSTKFWINEFFLPMVDVRRKKIFKPRAHYIASKFPLLGTGCIGDVGAGFGLFLDEIKKIWPRAKTLAIEPSRDMAKICKNKGLDVIESTVECIDPLRNQFDLLTAFELLEHLHNPENFTKQVYELLKPEGYFFLTTLNGLGFDIQLLWEQSKSVSPPHHLNFFNPQSIHMFLENIGFKLLEISTPGQLDWDIVEGGFFKEALDPGRFFKTVALNGSVKAKKELQSWISRHHFSSHMRIIAQKCSK